MPPLDAIPVVPLKPMMVVVVSFTVGKVCQQVIVSRRVIRVIVLTTPDMGERVDQEGKVMVENYSQDTGEKQRTPQVPMQVTDQQR